MKTKFIAVIMLSLLASHSRAQDWPQWRGANQDNKSSEENLLQSWPEEGPSSVWVFDQAGLGYAGFSIVGGKLYTMGLDGDSEFAVCLNAETGEQVWKTELGKRFNNRWGDGPRSTPTVDGDHVYFMAPKGDLVCLNQDGTRVWSVSMKDFGGSIPSWGYSESPLVDGDLVVCTPGGERGSLLALNKTNGEKVWQSVQATSSAHYSSVSVFGEGENKAYVQLLVDQIVSVSPADGTVNWSSEWPGRVAVIPSPIVVGNEVYVTSGYGAGSKKITVENGRAQESFSSKTMINHHGGIVLHEGHVYGYSDGKGFVCQDFESGTMNWNEKKKIKKGAVLFADNRFYYIEERSGDVILIEANPESWTERGRFTLSPQTEQRKPDGRIWVHPVISNGKLYLRDQEFIHCYDISGE
jgi:outer membrane protein assembly factor BamB